MRKDKMIAKLRKQNKSRKRQSMQLLQKNKKLVRLNGMLSSWKASTALFLTSLIMIILIVPALVVILPMTGGEEQETALQEDAGEARVDKEDAADKEEKDDDEKDEKEAPETETAMAEDNSVAVDVMRAGSEQVETVPLETYVTRVVASETPADFEPEALKAQSLAARTFIVNRLLYQEDDNGADVTDTTNDQVYHDELELKETMGSGYERNMKKIKKAVADTRGEILTYDDKPITAAFFSTSNGYTENSEDYWDNEVPYLRSVKSPWDKNTEKFKDQQVLTLAEVEKHLGTKLPPIDQLTIDSSETEGHRIDQLTLGDQSYSGREVREALNLASSDFSIEKKNNHLIFTTKGFGHGIGMSQFGANGMAEEGKTYEDIVKHYYQGVDVSNVSNTAPALAAKD